MRSIFQGTERKRTGADATDVVLTNRALGLQSLILCRDAQVNRSLFRVLYELGIATKIYPETGEALDALSRRKFDLLVVDCDAVAGGIEFLQAIRSTSSHAMATILAIVDQERTLAGAFRMGATLALAKPFSPNLLNLILRASMGNVLCERRRTFRHPVEIPVLLRFAQGQESRATVINLSEGGMAIHAPVPVPPQQAVRVSFLLPDTNIVMEAEGMIAWSEGHGRAGIRFLNVQPLVRRHFEHWLHQQFEQMTQTSQREFPGQLVRELLAGNLPLAPQV